MSEITIIQGEIFEDHRGMIYSLNDFILNGVKRYYLIHHPNTSIIRGWHAHQFEKKWFYCVKGSFTIAFVKIDDWENPSTDLPAEIYQLTDQKSEIICLPEGYANCLKANVPNSILLVFSGKILSEAVGDSWRYDSSLWLDWSKY
jgi:dTDP-4-dehydrorhamnose 3,5-epimerase